MRISDWSSDVCSSDLASPVAAGLACLSDEERDLGVALVELGAAVTTVSLFAGGMLVEMASLPRSEERRVGKEGVSTCRHRWSPFFYKKKQQIQKMSLEHSR